MWKRTPSITDCKLINNDMLKNLWKQLRRRFASFWFWADSVPIRMKIMGMVAGTAFLVGGWSVFQVNSVMQREAARQCYEMSMALARELSLRSQEYVLLNDVLGLNQLLRNSVRNLPDLRYAFVIDKNGDVVAHSFEGGFPMQLLSIKHDIAVPVEVLPIQTNEGRIWDAISPVLKGDAGFLRLGISEQRSNAARMQLLVALILTTLVVVALGIVFSGLLTWLLTRPLKELIKCTQTLKIGDFSVRARRISDDEIGQLAIAFNEMAAQLENAARIRAEHDAIRRNFLQKVILAQEEERKRIARELHDQIAQSLAFLMLELRILEQAKDQKAMHESIARLRSALTGELEAIRSMAMELRPLVLDEMGLAVALESYVKRFHETYGLKVDMYVHGFEDVRLPFYVETALYRIVQEALLNVVRHARASLVTFIMELVGGEIRGVVEDNGCGFDINVLVSSQRLGIYGMKERTELLGGSLEVESEPGAGTMVSFSIPIQRVCGTIQEDMHAQAENSPRG